MPIRPENTRTERVLHSYTHNVYEPLEERWLFRPVSRRIAAWLAPTGVPPTWFNILGLLATLFVGVLFFIPIPYGWIVIPVALYIAYLIDKIDGDLARAQGKAGGWGQYVDGFLDLVGEVFLTICAAIATNVRNPLLLGLAVAAPLLFYYHGIAAPFYLQKVASVHTNEARRKGWRTLFYYGRAKHFLLFAVLVLIGQLHLVFYILPLVALYTFILFLKNALAYAGTRQQ